MYTGRPLPRPPKLMNFLTKKRKHDNTFLDRSNEGEKKRRCRSQHNQQQQQQQILDLSSSSSSYSSSGGEPSTQLSFIDTGVSYEYSEVSKHQQKHAAVGFALLSQAAEWVSQRRLQSESIHYPLSNNDKILSSSTVNHPHYGNAYTRLEGHTSTIKKMTNRYVCETSAHHHHGHHHIHPFPAYPTLSHPYCSWQQQRRDVPIHQLQQQQFYQQGSGSARTLESRMNSSGIDGACSVVSFDSTDNDL